MVHAEAVLGYESVEVKLDFAERRDSSGAGRFPRFGVALEQWSMWHKAGIF